MPQRRQKIQCTQLRRQAAKINTEKKPPQTKNTTRPGCGEGEMGESGQKAHTFSSRWPLNTAGVSGANSLPPCWKPKCQLSVGHRSNQLQITLHGSVYHRKIHVFKCIRTGSYTSTAQEAWVLSMGCKVTAVSNTVLGIWKLLRKWILKVFITRKYIYHYVWWCMLTKVTVVIIF